MIKLIKENLVKSIIILVAAIITIVVIIVIVVTPDEPSKGEVDSDTTTVSNELDEGPTSVADEKETSASVEGETTKPSVDNTGNDESNEETTTAKSDDGSSNEQTSEAGTEETTTATDKTDTDTSETISNEEAEEQFKESGGTYVDNSDGTISITGGDVEGELIIPATIDGKPVVLSENAFAIMGYGNDTITSVEINAEVIGACAFQNCTALKTVIIGENVKEIGNGAFANCPALETVVFKGEGVTELPEYVFMGCPKMTSITLPASITKVHVGFITSYQPYVLEKYPNGPVEDLDYESIVPEFTLYTYSEPGEVTVWSNLYGAEYTEYDGLESIGTETRKANFKVEYLK